MLMDIYVRNIQNYMIKTSENGKLGSVVNSVTQEFLIIYKKLRSFIPPKVRKLTPILHHI